MYIILFNYTHTYIYIYIIYMCMCVSRDHSYSNLVNWIYTPPFQTFNGLASPGERLSSRASWGTQYLGWSGMIRGGLDGMGGLSTKVLLEGPVLGLLFMIFHAFPLIWCFCGGCVCMCLLFLSAISWYSFLEPSQKRIEKNTQSWIQLLYVKPLTHRRLVISG